MLVGKMFKITEQLRLHLAFFAHEPIFAHRCVGPGKDLRHLAKRFGIRPFAGHPSEGGRDIFRHFHSRILNILTSAFHPILAVRLPLSVSNCPKAVWPVSGGKAALLLMTPLRTFLLSVA